MFIYKNKHSDDMHSKIEGTVPSRDIEFFEGQGQNGDSDNVEEIYLVPRLGALIS